MCWSFVLAENRPGQRVARKPEEILREDPMPSLHVKAKESCKESVTVKTVKNEDFYRQDSYLERCFNKKQLVDSWYMANLHKLVVSKMFM